jgi:hypothetical protein
LGHISNYVPGVPCAAVLFINRWDVLPQADPLDPKIPRLNEVITDVIGKSSREAWAYKVESCGPKMNPTKLWSLLQNISGKKTAVPPNLPISFKNKPFTKPLSLAKKFNA